MGLGLLELARWADTVSAAVTLAPVPYPDSSPTWFSLVGKVEAPDVQLCGFPGCLAPAEPTGGTSCVVKASPPGASRAWGHLHCVLVTQVATPSKGTPWDHLHPGRCSRESLSSGCCSTGCLCTQQSKQSRPHCPLPELNVRLEQLEQLEGPHHELWQGGLAPAP